MPRGKGSAAKTPAPKKAAPKTSHPLAAPLPEGTILRDIFKGEWVVGRHVGKGGFGLIYAARRAGEAGSKEDFVVKIEPLSNGPLFCEIHFYQRVAKPEMIETWMKAKKVKSLGTPRFVAFGHHKLGGQEYRFLVMQRFGEDLQRIFERLGKRFSPVTAFTVGLKVIDTLEYMHDAGYAHADIKAANLLRGLGTNSDEIFLVDYGLVHRFRASGQCQPEREDPKRRHDGTLEFCSRDAHRGVSPSPRGDLEILSYCMLQWLGGRLPWERLLGNSEADKQAVFRKKQECMKDVKALAEQCQAGGMPDFVKFLEEVKRINYTDTPDYGKLRKLLLSAIQRAEGKGKGPRLEFGSAKSAEPGESSTKPGRGHKRGADTEPQSSPAKRRSGLDSKPISSGSARGAKSPAASARGAKSPAASARGAKSPAASARGAKSPAVSARGAKSPAASARGAKSPAASARGAETSDIIPGIGQRTVRRQSAGCQTSPNLLAAFKRQRRQRKNVVGNGDVMGNGVS